MTNRRYLTILALAAGVLAFGTSNAQVTETPDNNDGAAPAEQRPERQHRPPPRRKHMTEEQRAAARERWRNMSEEERQAKREKMRARRASKGGQHRCGKRDGQRPEGARPPKAEPDAV